MARHSAKLLKKYEKRRPAAQAAHAGKRRRRKKKVYYLSYPALSPLPGPKPAEKKRGVLYRAGQYIGNAFSKLSAKTADAVSVLRGELYEDPASFLRKTGYHIGRGFGGVGRFFSRISRFVLLPLSVMMVIAAAALFSAYTIGVKVTLDGETIGYMADVASFEQAQSGAEQIVSARINDSYKLDVQPVYSVALVPRSELVETETVQEYIAEISTDRLGKSYALYVDGQLVGTYARKSAIEEMLENIKRPYVTGEANETVDFLNDVQIQYGVYSEEFELTLKEMRNRLLSSDSPVVEYSVKQDEDLETIARSLNVDDKLILNLNPELDADNLSSGERILVPGSDPLLNVVIRRTVSYEEEIPYEVKSSQSADLWEGMEQVVTTGEPGLRRVTADILLINGVETDREIQHTETVQEPVTEIRLVGTKQIPIGEDGSYSTGSMIWPVPSGGLVTGRFGDWRGTHAHTALDIADSYNTTLVATDSGRVITAGWNEGGYGYNVWIDHGNGFTSRYSHCSAVLVETGQLVGQGQPIAYMGMTGNATGIHVHFEIQYNGRGRRPRTVRTP